MAGPATKMPAASKVLRVPIMSSSEAGTVMIILTGLPGLFPLDEAFVRSGRAGEPLHESRDAVPAQLAPSLGVRGHVIELHRIALSGEALVAVPGVRRVGEHQQGAVHRRHFHGKIIQIIWPP